MGKNEKKRWDVIVIGAGASGMMAAIIAARADKKVLILEKLDKAGKKLLATGNGKCNFTNKTMNTSCFHGEVTFIDQILEKYSVQDCLDFFYSIGIYPKEKNDYYYPNSEQAASVVTALVHELHRLKAAISYETEITSVVSKSAGISIATNKGQFEAKRLVIATGLLAAPKLGSDGSLFEVIKSLGHRFQPILPALCGYYCKGIDFKKVAGVRAHGTVTAYIDDKRVAEDTGEIQFTDYGLSGIPVFQISRFLSMGLYQKSNVQIGVNLLPHFDKVQLLNELNFRKKLYVEETLGAFLNGLIHQKLSDMIIDKLHLDKNIFVGSLSDKDIDKLATGLLEFKVTVTKYRDFEFAQVCTGGIPVSDIDKDTLESKLAKNIHFAGEILDVDGICGGYNLHFAWATGYIAGLAACRD